MGRTLITQSLLASWAYTFDCHETQEQSAAESFLQTLNRIQSDPTEAMLDGIAFEKEVYAEAGRQPRQKHPKWEAGIRKVSDRLRGAQFQVKAQRELELDGMTFLVYGIMDALKAGVIYDVKFKSKGFSRLDLAGDYLDSPQHPTYFYIEPGAYEFQYLVSDGEDLYIEKYTRDETRDIAGIIGEFIQSLKSNGLLDIYLEKWRAQ